MINERVLIQKADGSSYFGVGLRWEASDVLVVTPEDGSAVEKRAFLKVDRVQRAAAASGVDAQTVKNKYDISKMSPTSGNIDRYKSKFGEMK